MKANKGHIMRLVFSYPEVYEPVLYVLVFSLKTAWRQLRSCTEAF